MKSPYIHGPFSPILHQHCPLQSIKEVSKEPTQRFAHGLGDGWRRGPGSSPAQGLERCVLGGHQGKFSRPLPHRMTRGHLLLSIPLWSAESGISKKRPFHRQSWVVT